MRSLGIKLALRVGENGYVASLQTGKVASDPSATRYCIY